MDTVVSAALLFSCGSSMSFHLLKILLIFLKKAANLVEFCLPTYISFTSNRECVFLK